MTKEQQDSVNVLIGRWAALELLLIDHGHDAGFRLKMEALSESIAMEIEQLRSAQPPAWAETGR